MAASVARAVHVALSRVCSKFIQILSRVNPKFIKVGVTMAHTDQTMYIHKYCTTLVYPYLDLIGQDLLNELVLSDRNIKKNELSVFWHLLFYLPRPINQQLLRPI